MVLDNGVYAYSIMLPALYTIVQGRLSDINSRRLTSAPTTRIALHTKMDSIPYSVWMTRRAIKLDAELLV